MAPPESAQMGDLRQGDAPLYLCVSALVDSQDAGSIDLEGTGFL